MLIWSSKVEANIRCSKRTSRVMARVSSSENERMALLRRFVEENGLLHADLSPLAVDCSFRRYFRLRLPDNNFILMDAPPHQEDTKSFIQMSELLTSFGYSAPKILKKDVVNGFLLIEDFGDQTFTKALVDITDEEELYFKAIDILIDLYNRGGANLDKLLPLYSEAKLIDEAFLFVTWYLIPLLKLDISLGEQERYREAIRECLKSNQHVQTVLVLRDYHVDNLMVLPEREGSRACGLLDFQDAVLGPASYDVVSLLQDSRRDINQSLVDKLLDRYFQGIGIGQQENSYMKSYYSLGVQRALKVFGIFSRQDILYGNDKYLTHIPRLWKYTLQNIEAPVLEPIRAWICDNVPEILMVKEMQPGDDKRCL